MSQKPETVFRAKFVKKLKLIPHSWWESVQQKAIQGTPDIIGCVCGYFVGLELKATAAQKASELQSLKLDRIADAGGLSFLVNPENADVVLMALNQVAQNGGLKCSN